AVAIAQVDHQAVGTAAHTRQVGLAVAVEVADRHRGRLAADGDRPAAGERTGAGAHQEGYGVSGIRVAAEVGDGQVKVAVAVQVCGGHLVGALADRDGFGEGEPAQPVAEQDADRPVDLEDAAVGGDQVGLAVAVDVGGDDVD